VSTSSDDKIPSTVFERMVFVRDIRSGLNATEKSLLFSIILRVGTNDDTWASGETLATDAGLSRARVYKHFASLVSKQILVECGNFEKRRKINWPTFVAWNRNKHSSIDSETIEDRFTNDRETIEDRHLPQCRNGTPRRAKPAHKGVPNQHIMECQNGTHKHTEKPPTKKNINKVFVDSKEAGVGKQNTWKPHFEESEFSSLEAGDQRYQEAIDAGAITNLERSRLNWLTAWRYINRKYRAKKIKNPGGAFSKMLGNGDWWGDNIDEDAAKAFIRKREHGGGHDNYFTETDAKLEVPSTLGVNPADILERTNS